MSKFASQVSRTKSEIAFVDPGVSDLGTLLRHLRPEVDAFVLDRAQPAPAQIANALRGRSSSVTAAHVITHGRPGELSFSAGAVSLDNLDAHDGDFATIGRALGQDGALLLWSCNTGAGASGAAFVDRLEHATGIAVAAASHTIGAAERGGHWRLDTRSTARGVDAPLTTEGAANYQELLGPPPSPPGPGDIIVIHNGTASSPYSDLQDAINAAQAGDTVEIGAGLYSAENITVNTDNLTIENAPGAKVTIEGVGGTAAALTIGTGVYGVTVQSSDGVPGNFIVEGSQSTGQQAAFSLAGTNGGIKVNGITVQAASTGDGGLYAVQTGTELSNILFENSVFAGSGTTQLVDIQGTQAFGEQNGNVNFVGNTFSGSSNGSLLDMTAPGEIINNTFSGASQTTITLNQSGVSVTGNTFSTTPSVAYFTGDGSYDPTTIEANNSFPNQGEVFVIHNGVPQDGVFTNIQAAIDAAHSGDTVLIGNGNETDMLMRNSASGAFELYDISGNTITSASSIGSVGTEWQVTGVAADPPPGSASAAASTVLSGPTDDPADGASISQLTQAMASIATPSGTSTATSPLGQSPMPSADPLVTTMQNNLHA